MPRVLSIVVARLVLAGILAGLGEKPPLLDKPTLDGMALSEPESDT